jgi:hypothetical protein
LILVLAMLISVVAFILVDEDMGVANAQSSITLQILPSVGGTTDPGPGNYTYYEGGARAILTATAEPGWQFSYWLFFGPNMGGHQSGMMESNVIYDNPADVTHNYDYGGYTYTYQAVFVPSSTGSKPLGFPVEYFLPLAVTVVVVAVIAGLLGYTLGKRQGRKRSVG